MSPIACRECGNTDGPFVPGKQPVCEDCEPAAALRNALENGGWLDDKAVRLMGAYAATVLRGAADTLRAIPGNENAARIIDGLEQGLKR
ncbi:hypothetical protein [Streptomyces mirabilis]|uniref:hypothetical protein n=1 Tax=Streptomyces mirabilis TaxID=68239 RepID=UPI0036880A68